MSHAAHSIPFRKAGVLLCISTAALAEKAFFIPLGDLPGGEFFSAGGRISTDGSTVVGVSRGPDPGVPFQTSQEAFRWTASEGMVGLGDIDEAFVWSSASDVSGDGSVIVGLGTLGAGIDHQRPFRWTPATGMVQLVDPKGVLILRRANAVSDNGQFIVGHANPMTGGNLAYRWSAAGGAESLGALPNNLGVPDSFAFAVSADGNAVGGASFTLNGANESFRWTPAGGLVSIGDVPGGDAYSLAFGISPDGGTLVGNARHNIGGFPRDEAFIWSEDDGFRFPDPLRAAEFGSTAVAASAYGRVVVGYDGNVGGAMIWDAGNGSRSILAVLTDEFGLDLTGWTLLGASDITPDGTLIVGTGVNPEGNTEAWLARIPQPPSESAPALFPIGRLLALLGLLAAAVVVQKRLPRT